MSTIVGSLIMTAAIYIIIIAGAIIIFVSFAGCIGAIQEHKCLILTVSNGELNDLPTSRGAQVYLTLTFEP